MDFALDFDGTCVTHAYPNIGLDIGSQKVLKLLYKSGHRFILNTMRSDKSLKEAEQWCFDNGIPLKGSNAHPTQKRWTKSPKVYSHVYLDDAGFGMPLIENSKLSDRPYVDWPTVHWMFLQKKYITCFPYSALNETAYFSSLKDLSDADIIKETTTIQQLINEGIWEVKNNQIVFIGEDAEIHEKYFEYCCVHYN